MTTDQEALRTLIAKDEIRELAMLYCRGVDRKDAVLLASLYTKDATDAHGPYFNGPAADYVKWLERGMPGMRGSGHHVCNHLIAVNGDEAEGEVYALCTGLNPDGKGGTLEDLMAVRYIDRYRKEDGRWKFAARVVSFDWRSTRPGTTQQWPLPAEDPSYATLSSRLFARGART